VPPPQLVVDERTQIDLDKAHKQINALRFANDILRQQVLPHT
jgi:hypothetical protein